MTTPKVGKTYPVQLSMTPGIGGQHRWLAAIAMEGTSITINGTGNTPDEALRTLGLAVAAHAGWLPEPEVIRRNDTVLSAQ